MHEGEFVPAAWRTAEEHLFAVDLFNAGYYWEAHEAWEGLWRRAQGTPKLLLHGLIQAAAVLLKHAQRMPDSVRTLGPSALAKLDGVLADLPPDAPFLLGVNVRAMRNDFARFIEPVLNDAPHAFDAGGDPPKIVLGVE
ncbi:DUF309 domain-containing protein [bacterium]|nr:DUF309 domain-containing protein [bacterium]